ncbi:hypothetical protein ALC57_05017, partial [Trachymyrmex cornetzi]
PHYTAVLNLAGIEFPMILKDIQKFEQLNAVSINVYSNENKQVLPVRLTSDKKEKHINVLYLQDPRKDGVGHFARIKNLSRLVSSQLSKKEHKKCFCDRQCSGRYAQVNNKYMRSYDSSKPLSYLMYYDVNNLYGWAMCQPLPYAEFQWVKDVANFDVSAIALDSPIGYIFEVDLEYPQHLHDIHADLPFCPTRDKPPGKCEDKLLATLYNKQRYVIHYRNLQQCTRHGLRVTKIHRVLQFAQSPWLREYIQLNTNFRIRAKNDFEKNLYKLMNNAVFRKTMENVRNHVDVKLLTKWDGRYGAEAMIAKPNFHSRSIFAENLNKCKIMYTDTDSLIYHIECENIYETIKCDFARFDTSDYPADNAYCMSLANTKVPGLMKDEYNGMITTEFVGLRAKMYTVRVDGKKDTKKAKGVKNNIVARTITFDDYTRCLNEEIEMTRRQSCIQSKLHEVYTISESKIALSPYDDKRYVVPNTTETLPWGHWPIPL